MNSIPPVSKLIAPLKRTLWALCADVLAVFAVAMLLLWGFCQ